MFQQLSTEAEQSITTLFGVKDISVVWGVPTQRTHGDLTTTVALKLAQMLSKPPRDIAQQIADALANSPSVDRAEVAGAGYINVWLKPDVLLEALEATQEVLTLKKAKKKDAPVVIDYSQPNIAKPLGVHHILSTIIGQSLANLYRHAGYTVIAVNHIGDWGTQFGKLAVALQRWGKKPVEECTLDDLLASYVRFHEEAEKDPTLEDEARAEFLKLEQGDKKLHAFWEAVIRITMEQIEGMYQRLHVSFDHTMGESFYEDKMQAIIEEGKKKGVIKPGEKGAWIAEFPPESNLPPAVVLKADGATIYMTRDLATVRYRMDTWKPASILYVVDVAQKLYFEQLFAIVNQMKWDLPLLEHVMFGRMRFADKSMSTRKGNILKLEHVLDEAVTRAEAVITDRGESIQTDNATELAEMMGVGALVYGILSQNRRMDIIFDWDKMLSFEGNSAPYLQYTHARACSVLRKADMKTFAIPAHTKSLAAGERGLIQMLLQFPQVLTDARTEHLPHKLAQYLYGLAQDFNLFYNTDPILQAQEPARTLRLALTSLTASVLKTGAELLTLRVPDRM